MKRNSKADAIKYWLIGLLGVFTLLLIAGQVHASEFPSDAVTDHLEWSANLPWTVVYATSTRTFLGISSIEDGSTNVEISCGNPVVLTNHMFENHKQGFINYIPVSYHCSDAVYEYITGYAGTGGHYLLTWVDRDTRITTDPVPPTLTLSSTSSLPQTLFNGLILFFGVFFFIVWNFRRSK